MRRSPGALRAWTWPASWCEERFGRLDGLVNAAGLSSRATLDDTSIELRDRLFAST